MTKSKGFQEEIPFLIEITYFALRFDDVIRVYRDKFIKMKWPYLPALTYPYLMSLVRTGHRQEALDEAKEILNTIRTFKKATPIRISAHSSASPRPRQPQ